MNGKPARFEPTFEVKQTRRGLVFQLDLPGLKEEDLHITLIDQRLTISGKRDAEAETADVVYARRCFYGGFSRGFTLPEGIRGGHGFCAELSRGVLTLFVPYEVTQPSLEAEDGPRPDPPPRTSVEPDTLARASETGAGS